MDLPHFIIMTGVGKKLRSWKTKNVEYWNIDLEVEWKKNTYVHWRENGANVGTTGTTYEGRIQQGKNGV